MPRQTLDSDPLTGANNTDLGSEWDAGYTGRVNLQLLSNTAQATVLATRSLESFNATTAGGDQWAAVTLTSFGSTVYTNYLVMCRASAAPTLSGYGAFREASAVSVVKWTGGTISTLSTGASTRTNGEVLSLECVGTTITAFVNGVSIASATDATYATGRAGIGCYVDTGGATSHCQLNTFQMGDFTGGGATHFLDADTVSFEWEVQAVTFTIGGGAPSGAWPNQPTGATVLSDHPFNTIDGNGWARVWPSGAMISDATAPTSPPNVYHERWVNHSFSDIALPTYTFPANTHNFYLGVWWKPSNPFYGWQSVQFQKLFLLEGSHTYVFMYRKSGSGASSVYGIMIGPDAGNNNQHVAAGVSFDLLFPNMNNPNVPLGQWNRLEWFVQRSTNASSRDGIFRWWLNGTLCGDYTNINFNAPSSGFSQLFLHHVWDAVDPQQVTDTHSTDHIRLTTGGTGSGGGGGGPPQVLPAPENLSPFTTIPYGTTTFSWDAVGGAVGYALRVHKIGTPYEPTDQFLFYGEVTLTIHVLVTEASSSYDWWVHAINSAAELGPANGRTFSTTAIEVPPDPDPDPDPDPPPDPPVDPPPVDPPPVVDTPTTSPDVLPSGVAGAQTTTVVNQDRLNPITKEFRHYG